MWADAMDAIIAKSYAKTNIVTMTGLQLLHHSLKLGNFGYRLKKPYVVRCLG
jgi:hypothetical protein